MTRVYDHDLKGYWDDCDICQGGRIDDASPCPCNGTGRRYHVIYLDADEMDEDYDLIEDDGPMIDECEHGKVLVCEECAKRHRSTA